MASTQPRYDKDEFARRGDALYASRIEPALSPKDVGKFVAIDVETGEYEVDVRQLTACDRLRARIPDAQIWVVRAGSGYVHRFGARSGRAGS
jgi:hypothetical protein